MLDLPNAEYKSRERLAVALWRTASHGQVDIGRILLQRGAPLVHPHDGRISPIHAAAERGHVDFICLLLEYSINLDTVNKRGETALMVAAKRGQKEVVKALLHAGSKNFFNLLFLS